MKQIDTSTRVTTGYFCGECSDSVIADWRNNTYHCNTCDKTYTDIVQCLDCGRLMGIDTNILICGVCERQFLES